MRGRLAIAIAAAAALSAAAPAGAHIQVTPTSVATDDAVRFELLVPNERESATVEVSLQIPKGVLPFSFEETPGWKRSVEEAPDGSIGVVKWTGELAPTAFVRFSMLASTPPEAGELAWKALQRYEDGETVRWIGARDADEPAAVTVVSAATPKQNAGGESGAVGAPAAAKPAVAATTPAGDGDDGRDPLALGLAAAALLLALGALALNRRGGTR